MENQQKSKVMVSAPKLEIMQSFQRENFPRIVFMKSFGALEVFKRREKRRCRWGMILIALNLKGKFTKEIALMEALKSCEQT